MNLTDEQLAIIEHIKHSKNNLLVRAKAGAAKTTTLEQAAHAFTEHQNCMALTFSVNDKTELEKRFPKHFTILNINGLGHRAWMKLLGRKLEIDKNKTGTLISAAIKERGLDKIEGLWDSTRRLVSAAKLNGLVLKDAPGSPKVFIKDDVEGWDKLSDLADIPLEPHMVDVARAVLHDCVTMAYHGNLDFDEQIYMASCFGGAFPRYKLVMVDEAQDLSILNHHMIRRVVAGKIVAVGDEFQSIYAFRGAAHDSMDRLQETFSMEQLGLSISFRCDKAIIRHAQELVPGIRPWPEKPEGEVIQAQREWVPNYIKAGSAVLCRNNAPLIGLAFKLLKCRRPVKFLKSDFGKGLVQLALKLANHQRSMTTVDFAFNVNKWRNVERAKALEKKNEAKADLVDDKAEGLLAVADGTETVGEVVTALESIFSDKAASITFSTVHGAKGREWDTVYILEGWLLRRGQRGDDPQSKQERNADYVARTRAKHTLAYINMSGFVDF